MTQFRVPRGAFDVWDDMDAEQRARLLVQRITRSTAAETGATSRIQPAATASATTTARTTTRRAGPEALRARADAAARARRTEALLRTGAQGHAPTGQRFDPRAVVDRSMDPHGELAEIAALRAKEVRDDGI